MSNNSFEMKHSSFKILYIYILYILLLRITSQWYAPEEGRVLTKLGWLYEHIINKSAIQLYSVGLIKFDCRSIQLLLNVYFVLPARSCVEISRNSSKKTNLIMWLRWEYWSSIMHRLSVIDLRGSFLSATNSTKQYKRVRLFHHWPLI